MESLARSIGEEKELTALASSRHSNHSISLRTASNHNSSSTGAMEIELNADSCSVGTPALAYSILWSPIPIITWILPFVGHMGIADSKGVVYDFQGPYTIGKTTRPFMAFGPITRSFRVDVSSIDAQQWDESVYEANVVYKGRMHNLFCDNCHSHVANALNRLSNVKINGIQKFNMVNLAIILFFRGRFLSLSGIIHQFGPFLAFVLLYHFFFRS